MANDVDLYQNNGGVQPYSPSQPLAPAPDWGLSNRDEYTQGGGQMILGEPLPQGITIKQALEHYQQLGDIFSSDFIGKLGHNVSQTQKAVKWFMDALTNPPTQQRKLHGYELFEHTNDPIFQAFANYAHANGFSAKFVQDACWWVSEASKRLNAGQQQVVGTQMPRMAPIDSDPTEQLSDQQYATLIKHNENIKAETMNRLAAKYGKYTYRQVIELAQRHLESLPAADRQHFDRWTGDFPWTHMLSTFEAIDALYGMSIGINSIGNGADIAREIASYEAMLKVPSERAKYMRDPAMQARLVELYRRRGG